MVITNLEAFEAACKQLGIEFHKGQKSFVAYNVGQCDHAVHFPGLRYELGLVGAPLPNGKTGYEPKLDYFSDGLEIQHKLCKKLDTPIYHSVSHADPKYSVDFEHLKKAYAIEVLKGQAVKNGYKNPIFTQLPDGKTVMKVSKGDLSQYE